MRLDRDWLIIASHDSDFFVKARYDQKKRQWLPQSGWRFNQQEADLITEKVSGVSIGLEKKVRRNSRRR